MQARSNLWLGGLAVGLIAAAALLGWRMAGIGAGEARASAVPRPPDVRLAALGGGTVGFEDFAGRIVVVDFWASWCGPCRLQAKILEPLHEKHAEQVQFLAVNLGEDLATVERYVGRNAFPYPVLMDPEERLGVELEIYALPTVMVLDRTGRISYLQPGITDGATLSEALEAAGMSGMAAG